MKFNGDHILLSGTEASLIGRGVPQQIGWRQGQQLYDDAREAFTAEIAAEWRSVDAFRRSSMELEDVIKSPVICGFDSWRLGQMILTLEKIPGILDEETPGFGS